MKLAVGIAHAPWDPARVENVRRMIQKQLHDFCPRVYLFASKKPEPASVWARRLWAWGAEQSSDAVVYLNDDVELCDDFLDVVAAMYQGEPLSLHTSAPDQVTMWAKCYWLTGPAYVLSPKQTKSLLKFSEDNWSQNEDNMGIRWAWKNQTPFYSPIPCPVRHIASIPSTLGYDDHPYRVTPHFQKTLSRDPEYWKFPKDVPLVDNPWWRP